MSAITRADAAKGYSEQVGSGDESNPERASFLGVPSEIRSYVYEMLFADAYMLLDHQGSPEVLLNSHPPNVAILSICRQVNEEARPVLLATLELQLGLSTTYSILDPISARLETTVLPHIRKIRFYYPMVGSLASDLQKTAVAFLPTVPLLQSLRLEGLNVRMLIPTVDIYQAIVNGTRIWTAENGFSRFASHNGFLSNDALLNYGPAVWCPGVPQRSPSKSQPEVDRIEQCFAVTADVKCHLVDDERRKAAHVHIIFDPKSMQVLRRSVLLRGQGDITTVREARLWAFGEDGWKLEGETAEQADIEGRKLLADLRE